MSRKDLPPIRQHNLPYSKYTFVQVDIPRTPPPRRRLTIKISILRGSQIIVSISRSPPKARMSGSKCKPVLAVHPLTNSTKIALYQ
nr:hypothetical protein Q903MT_gene1995 [Picea sitchensis]